LRIAGIAAAAQGHVTRAPWSGIFSSLAIFLAVHGLQPARWPCHQICISPRTTLLWPSC